MSFIPILAATPKKLLKYLLRATFDASDQGYADAQVLDTVAEGVLDGQLTVVEVDGTLAIVSNKCASTAQGAPTYGNLGFYSQGITKALGTTLLWGWNRTAGAAGVGWSDGIALESAFFLDYSIYHHTGTIIWCNRNNTGINRQLAAVALSTDYEGAIVLGGYDVNGMPWRSGQTAASYLYGAAFFIKGGTYSTWTLIWRMSAGNETPLYAQATYYDAVDALDDFRVPDLDLSAVLQPTCLSTFTAANGTSLDAITPEVGGAWTEQAGQIEIQSNRAKEPDSASAIATVDSGISDVIIDAILHVPTGSGGDYPAVVCRYSGNTASWLALIDIDQSKLFIYEYNGGLAERASAAVALSLDTDYEVRIIADGQQIDCFVDGGNKVSYGSAAFNEAQTEHGLRLAPDNVADNFAVFARTSSVYESTLDSV